MSLPPPRLAHRHHGLYRLCRHIYVPKSFTFRHGGNMLPLMPLKYTLSKAKLATRAKTLSHDKLPKRIAIYGLYDTRTPEAIFYVGQTYQLRHRLKAHLRGYDLTTSRTVNQITSEGGSVEALLLALIETPSFANQSEDTWIQHYRRLNSGVINSPRRLYSFPLYDIEDPEGDIAAAHDAYILQITTHFGLNTPATHAHLSFTREEHQAHLLRLGLVTIFTPTVTDYGDGFIITSGLPYKDRDKLALSHPLGTNAA